MEATLFRGSYAPGMTGGEKSVTSLNGSPSVDTDLVLWPEE